MLKPIGADGDANEGHNEVLFYTRPPSLPPESKNNGPSAPSLGGERGGATESPGLATGITTGRSRLTQSSLISQGGGIKSKETRASAPATGPRTVNAALFLTAAVLTRLACP